MTMSIDKFKRLCAAKRGRGRYPKAARQWAIRYAQGRLAGGSKVGAVAGELGISDMTLRSWLYATMEERNGQLCEVVVAEPEPDVATADSRGVIVTTAQGHVVAGLDLEGAAALLKALG